ncbi:thioesterase superfamily protein [Dactylonectria estremocensis]|uniref:Thioesterase superfamily protein n=1 Tax=Dactylonectria estremocensis TaxID=1079267 RepID=A0A9P9ELW6_9HYPO|nr:thioesterase superfamily protein [Dactylonectria estremocensis]
MESPNDDLQYFSRVPWCRAHLEEPGAITTVSPSCTAKETAEDELFARTLRTTNTIRAFVAIYRLPESPQQEIIRDFKYLISLQQGLSGYPGVCHGGIVATVLDEVLGIPFLFNQMHNNLLDGAHMTGELTIKYLRPVPLRCSLLCRVSIVRSEGRKYFVNGHIEDENGEVLAKGESIYISLKPKL